MLRRTVLDLAKQLSRRLVVSIELSLLLLIELLEVFPDLLVQLHLVLQPLLSLSLLLPSLLFDLLKQLVLVFFVELLAEGVVVEVA